MTPANSRQLGMKTPSRPAAQREFCCPQKTPFFQSKYSCHLFLIVSTFSSAISCALRNSCTFKPFDLRIIPYRGLSVVVEQLKALKFDILHARHEAGGIRPARQGNDGGRCARHPRPHRVFGQGRRAASLRRRDRIRIKRRDKPHKVRRPRRMPQIQAAEPHTRLP